MLAIFKNDTNTYSYEYIDQFNCLDIKIIDTLPPRGSYIKIENVIYRIYKYKTTIVNIDSIKYDSVIVYVDEYIDDLDIDSNNHEITICDPEISSKIKLITRTSKISNIIDL